MEYTRWVIPKWQITINDIFGCKTPYWNRYDNLPSWHWRQGEGIASKVRHEKEREKKYQSAIGPGECFHCAAATSWSASRNPAWSLIGEESSGQGTLWLKMREDKKLRCVTELCVTVCAAAAFLSTDYRDKLFGIFQCPKSMELHCEEGCKEGWEQNVSGKSR